MSYIVKKRVAAAAAAIMMLWGCSASGGYGVTITKEEQETDYSSVYAEIISFSGFANKEYEDRLNDEIEENIRASISGFDEMAQELSKELPPGLKSDLKITQNVKRNSSAIISWIEEQYVYSGGAHGITGWFGHTINLDSESPHNLDLSELFKDESYVQAINNIIDDMVKTQSDKYSELWAEPHIDGDVKWGYYLTDEELVIYFPPYELSYYAKGFIEFPIRLTELSGFLKEEYKTETK